MSLIGPRTQYLNLEQIDRVCADVASRLLVGTDEVIAVLRRELIALSANGLRSSALGQGLFGPHAPRPGLVALAGPGGIGKSFFGELLARVIYGEQFVDHLITVNCRSYFAGRFPPLPREKLESGPLAIVALDAAEVLPEIPPVAALWSDAIRYGRASLPPVSARGEITQVELSFARALIVTTANVARDQAGHFGFRPENGRQLGRDESARVIRAALAELFEDSAADVFPPERWVILPPLERAGMRRLVDLQLNTLAELLPKGSPPIQISDDAATRLIELALASTSPVKTVSLVDLMQSVVEPPVNAALLEIAAPVPVAVQINLDSTSQPLATVQTVRELR